MSKVISMVCVFPRSVSFSKTKLVVLNYILNYFLMNCQVLIFSLSSIKPLTFTEVSLIGHLICSTFMKLHSFTVLTSPTFLLTLVLCSYFFAYYGYRKLTLFLYSYNTAYQKLAWCQLILSSVAVTDVAII